MSPFVQPTAVQHADRLLARSVLFLLLGLFTATFVGIPENPDAEVEFQTTSSLAREHSLALGGTPEADAIIAAGHAVRRGGPGREERVYSWFGVGQALVGLPFYVAGEALGKLFPGIEERNAQVPIDGVRRSEYFAHLLVGWRNPLLGALTAWLVVTTAVRLGAKSRQAWIGGLTYGLCTFAWPQARSSLSDVQATFFLFLAFHEIVRLRERYRLFRAPRIQDCVLLGLALGGAVLTRIAVLPAALVLTIAAMRVVVDGRRKRGRQASLLRDAFWIGAPALACAALFFAANERRFGDPLETGYTEAIFGDGTYFSYPPLAGLASLLVSPGRGLLFLAPAVLLVPLWIGVLFRRRDRLTIFVLAGLTLAVIGPVVATQGWHGAWTYGPRYVLPLLPFLWLAVPMLLDGRSFVPRLLTPALLILGLITSLPGVLVDYTTHHDLALQAARLEWPEPAGDSEFERDEARFLSIQADWRFAAPWAHWRILRHRVAELGENFPVREIFYLDSPALVTPRLERSRGYRHFAWVDYHERLHGTLEPAWALCLTMIGLGLILAIRGLSY